ncbi:DUF3180 family protein [Schaalia vaccimaxillae]|uniref:DUF3180 family protein n=1 Tax=Schaalia vaccimaxillae TaxID=183916 RepID=UPI0003B6006D|nr:DUF3180 family protein [Schaalia vaccimaxillae]
MKPISLLGLAGIGVATGAISAVVTFMMITVGGSPVIITPFLAVLMLCIAGTLWWAGLHVRRFRSDKDTWMTALAAARVAAAARASCAVGALMCGGLLGIAVACLMRMDAAAMLQNALAAGLAAVAAGVLTSVGVVVERWCTLEPDDDQDAGGQTPTASPA